MIRDLPNHKACVVWSGNGSGRSSEKHTIYAVWLCKPGDYEWRWTKDCKTEDEAFRVLRGCPTMTRLVVVEFELPAVEFACGYPAIHGHIKHEPVSEATEEAEADELPDDDDDDLEGV